MKVIGIGDNVVDDYQHIQTVFPGGNALNFSVFASMLGCDSSYLGVFGNDSNAEHIQCGGRGRPHFINNNTNSKYIDAII